MGRISRSVSFDEETWQLIEENDDIQNVSAFLRDITRDYLSKEDGRMEEINRLRREADELEEEAQRKRQKADTLERGLRAEEWKEGLEEKKEELEELRQRISELEDFEYDSIQEIEDWAREFLEDKGIDTDDEENVELIRRQMEEKVRKYAKSRNLEELRQEKEEMKQRIEELETKIPDEEMGGDDES